MLVIMKQGPGISTYNRSLIRTWKGNVMASKNILTQMLVLAMVLMMGYSVHANEPISPDELIEKIRYSERLLHDMQAKASLFTVDSGDMIADMEWYYKKGKERIEKREWFGKEGDKPQTVGIEAYDGRTHFGFTQNTDGEATRGGIGPLLPLLFTVMTTPKSLLGYTIKQYSTESLSDILSKCKEIHVAENTENIDGNDCYLIEARGLTDGKKGTSLYDLRVWIDFRRDYRPLQIERYYPPGSKRGLHVKPPYSAIRLRCSNIVLKSIDGVWFPVSGDKQAYNHKLVPPGNMSKREFFKKYSGLSEDEVFQKLELKITPAHPLRRIELQDIRLNKGIPDEKFTIEFPPGCSVYDRFLQQGYVVGGTHSDIGSQLPSLENAVLESKTVVQPDQQNQPAEDKPTPSTVPKTEINQPMEQLATVHLSKGIQFSYMFGVCIAVLAIAAAIICIMVIRHRKSSHEVL